MKMHAIIKYVRLKEPHDSLTFFLHKATAAAPLESAVMVQWWVIWNVAVGNKICHHNNAVFGRIPVAKVTCLCEPVFPCGLCICVTTNIYTVASALPHGNCDSHKMNCSHGIPSLNEELTSCKRSVMLRGRAQLCGRNWFVWIGPKTNHLRLNRSPVECYWHKTSSMCHASSRLLAKMTEWMYSSCKGNTVSRGVVECKAEWTQKIGQLQKTWLRTI